MTFRLSQYQSSWPSAFEALRDDLERTLGKSALAIDHIGSTSVPGLVAKDIIDIQVTVDDLDKSLITIMTDAGYKHHPELRMDHLPQGEPEDAYQWQKLVFSEKSGQRRATIHIRQAGLANHSYALVFRDFLRANEQAVLILSRIKRDMARYHGDDEEAYFDLRDPVYDLLWLHAREWQRRQG